MLVTKSRIPADLVLWEDARGYRMVRAGGWSMRWEIQQRVRVTTRVWNMDGPVSCQKKVHWAWREVWHIYDGNHREVKACGWYKAARGPARRKITEAMRHFGRRWLERHLRLIESPPKEIRCDDVDGGGMPCPVQSVDHHCPVREWNWHGYGGQYPGYPLPGRCTAPERQKIFPTGRDSWGCPLEYYFDLMRGGKE